MQRLLHSLAAFVIAIRTGQLWRAALPRCQHHLMHTQLEWVPSPLVQRALHFVQAVLLCSSSARCHQSWQCNAIDCLTMATSPKNSPRIKSTCVLDAGVCKSLGHLETQLHYHFLKRKPETWTEMTGPRCQAAINRPVSQEDANSALPM